MSIKGYYDRENCCKFETKFKVNTLKDVVKYLKRNRKSTKTVVVLNV